MAEFNKITDNKKDIDRSNPLSSEDFFPYSTYRPEQKETIDKLAVSIKKRSISLLIAPNGTGKTPINLSSVLPEAINKDRRIIYVARTHTQCERVIDELILINNIKFSNSKRKISGIALRGRGEMCLNPTVNKLKPKEQMDRCSKLKKNGNCQYHSNMYIKEDSTAKFDLRQFQNQCVKAPELLDFCKRKKFCPYLFSKELIKDTDVIVCNYIWIFHPFIRSSLLFTSMVSIEDSIIIIDECHNLINIANELNSYSLSEKTIKDALTQLKKVSDQESKFYDEDICKKIQDIKALDRIRVTSSMIYEAKKQYELKENSAAATFPIAFRLDK